MSIKIGSTDVTDIKVGDTNVDNVMVGSNVVWERETATTGGVWSGSATSRSGTASYNDLCATANGDYEWSDTTVHRIILKNMLDGTWKFGFTSSPTGTPYVRTISSSEITKHSKTLSFQYDASSGGTRVFNINLTWSAS